ncbi:MAG: TonB family protein [Paludibacteraceae bacterium]|nr:TonB family protein [Paludibacteraceae bacterium]
MDLYRKSNLAGFVGSWLFLVVLLLVLLFCSLSRVIPDTEEGLAVSLGVDEVGGEGFFEPTPASEVEEVAAAAAETPVSEPVAGNEDLMTQDIEESYQAPEVKKKKEKTKEEIERERRLAEEKKQREKELKEKKRLEAEAKAKREAEERMAQEIRNRAKNAFGGNGAGGLGNADNSTGNGGGGSTGSAGNVNGDVNNSGTSGSAKSGNGVSWSLGGRSLVGQLSKPQCRMTEEGEIVMQITVDKDGNVISAEPVRGTKIVDQSMREAARKAAMKAKFNPNPKGNNQTGTITYKFSYK